MKKILFTFFAVFSLFATTSAQSMKVYQNGQLRAIYYVSKGDRVEFSEDFPFPEDDNDNDDYNGHEYVDLGLPSGLKWATCNVGATSPEEYGDFFAWGETDPKTIYAWSTYKWCNGSEDTMTKYCTSSSYGTVDNKTVLDPEDDAAHVNWGGAWRMPTRAEQDELREKCTWMWTTQEGVNGCRVTGPNGNSIFLPAAGNHCNAGRADVGSNGYYWSSSLFMTRSYASYFLKFNSVEQQAYGCYRCEGNSIRPVCQ